MELNVTQQIVDQWIQEVGVRYFDELTNLGILMEEVGELSRLFVREFGEQSYKNPEDAKLAKTHIADEMADVLFVLICLANQTGVDLEDAMIKNLEKKTKRDLNRHRNNPKL